MTIIKKTMAIFDPRKEYFQANEFGDKNPEFVRSEDTVAITFTKDETYYVARRENN